MKFKVLYILAIVGLMSFTSNAQRVNGARIGYIATEYILQNVPDYQEATSQLEVKLTKWHSGSRWRLMISPKRAEFKSVLMQTL